MRTTRLLWVLTLLFVASLGRAQSFAAREPLPANPRGEPFTFSIDGMVYLGSGGYENDFYKYDPAADAWTPLGELPGISVSRGFSVSFVIEGKAYVGLGMDNGETFLNDFWEYDPATGQWDQKHDFPGGARMGAFGFAAGGKGYVGGGTDFQVFYGDLYSYDPVLDEWELIGANPLQPTVFTSTFNWDGYGYILCGGLVNGQETSEAYKYDHVNNEWSQKTDFPGDPREAAACFVLGDRVYLGTGQTQFTTAYTDFWSYDPEEDTWAPAGTFPGAARGWTGACSTGSRAFVGMGWDLGNVLFNDWWEFAPAVGLDEPIDASAELELFPVPASVVDAEGRVVRSAFTVGELRLDLTGLNAGSYDVVITGKRSAPVHKRFVKL
jgi:N-acetylneuraminic acid mutarotase